MKSGALALDRMERILTSLRCFLSASALMLLLTAGAAAQDRPAPSAPAPVDPRLLDLAKPGPAGDMALGAKTAPVTVIEYASMTCTHCAHFATTTFPELKKRYIDTGKVRYILREFPLNALSEAAFLLARCAGKDKYFNIVATLFAKQSEWVVRNPVAALKKELEPFGFTDASFNKCLADNNMRMAIEAVSFRAAGEFGVHSTPTFFVNGTRIVGDRPITTIATVIDAEIKK